MTHHPPQRTARHHALARRFAPPLCWHITAVVQPDRRGQTAVSGNR